MKKFNVDCETWPRSRIRPRGISLIIQRNSFSPFETRKLADGASDETGPGFDCPVAGAAAPPMRALGIQFMRESALLPRRPQSHATPQVSLQARQLALN